MKEYFGIGDYHLEHGQFEDVVCNKKENIKNDLSIKEICEIREKCGCYKYTYDENYDLCDFCIKNNIQTICIPMKNCINNCSE